MKHRLKKMNRGLLLGAVLLLGFVIFVMVKDAQFQKSVPDIKEMSKEYVEAMMALNEMPEGAMTEDFHLTSQVTEQKTAAMEEILKKYWNAETKQKNLRGVSGIDLRRQYQDYVEREQFSQVFDIEFNLSEKDIEVKSDGPNRAKVSLFTEDLYVTFCGTEAYCLFLGGNTWGVNEIEDMFVNFNPMEDPTRKKSNLRFRLDMELELVKGEWKIISCTSDYWNYGTTVVVDEEITIGGDADE